MPTRVNASSPPDVSGPADDAMDTAVAALLAALPGPAALLSTDGRVRVANPAWLTPGAWAGLPRRPAEGASLTDALATSGSEASTQLAAALTELAAGRQDRHTQTLPPIQDERGWWRAEARPFHDLGHSTEAGRGVLLSLREVTEQVETRRTLERSEERYRVASDGALDAFFLLEALRGPDGRIEDFVFLDINPSGCEMISRGRDEVVGQRLCELLPVNREPRFIDRYREVMQTGETLLREFEIDAADEGITPSWMQQQVVRVGDGIAISVRDVTGRKQTELELKHQRQETQTVLDGVPAYVFYKDADNRILRVNRAAAESLGLPPQQIEGRATADFYPAEVAAAYHRDDREVLASGRPKLGYLETNPVPGGEDRWIRTDKVPVFDDHGEATSIIAVATDVTDLQHATQRLAESERRFRSLFDRVPVSVWEQDLREVARWLDELKASGVRDLGAYLREHPEAHDHAVRLTKINGVNQATFDLMEAADHVELSRSMYDGHVGPPPEALAAKLGAIWDGRRSAELETYCHTVRGRKLHVLMRFEVPEQDGEPDLGRAILALTDISANRQRLFAQAQVLQAERERKRLAHELHDTLAQQIAGVNMLAESLRRRLASDRPDDLEQAGQRATELSEMLKQANREVRRLLSGLSAERIGPDELETALESLAERTSLVHQVPVTFRCPRTPDELDEDSANHLLYIAQEAVHNAAKHAEADSIQIDLEQGDDGLRLSVVDDGRGIGPPAEPHDPTESSDGSGLGLSIMRFRAEAIGAKIRFDSFPDVGTAVRCFMPAAEATDADPDSFAPPSPDPQDPPR
ncbi:MAG: PAS domain-containing protein [Planctomycetota bacterium]